MAEVAAAAGGVATSVDARGVPQFLWATSRQPAFPGATPETAARFHLGRFAHVQGLTSAALSSAEVAHVHDMGPGGVITRLRQRVDGIEVYRGDVRVLMKKNLDLVAISGRLQPTAVSGASGRDFRHTPAEALADALNHRYGARLSAGQVIDLGPGHAAQTERRLQVIAGAPIAIAEQARTKKVYFPEGDRLIPAYLVEFYAGARDSVESEAYRYVVAADDGRVLETRNLTASDVFNYRVWAEATGDRRPLDGPQADYTPHPTGTPNNSDPAFIPPNLVAIEGFNHNPAGVADSWLVPGTTQTLGNNADAYSDYVAPDGYSNGDYRAVTTGASTFDYTYDTALGPQASLNQTMAATVQAFYVVNWLHDWFYDSGFTEAAGNAQRDNFHRGGEGGDAMRVEVQDSYLAGQRNNANMSTPLDGTQPRMQIYVFTGPDIRRLTLNPSGTNYATGTASFGAGNFNLTADLVLVDDGSTAGGGTVTDGCQVPVNNVVGRIVLIDRGVCNFVVKAANAQAAGAAGVIIANNAAGSTPPGLGGTDATITIPVASVTQADGVTLRNLPAPVNVTMFRQLAVERDAALDNMIVAHEWGHYLHHRLADCGSGQCSAISEGWGDFTALLMALREGDNLNGTYAAGVYAPRTFGDSGYFGIRRFPYSYDMTRNALTLRHISNGVALPSVPQSGAGAANNAEVHNAGEVWATMMFDAYVALQQARPSGRTFDEVRRRMTDYVVAGLLLSPVDATYTEQRDAILAAIAARDANDLTVVANAFARRGAGSCAVVPDRYSTTFVGVTESYAVQPRSEIGAVTLDDSVTPCDRDGVLDAGERGRLTITVANGGAVAMNGTTVRVSSTTPGITFPNGTSATVNAIGPFGTATVSLDVALDASVTGATTFNFDVSVDNAAACQATVTRSLVARINYDDQANASATDAVESPTSAWTRTGFEADQVWQRAALTPTNFVWLGIDSSSQSDTQLTSPDLVVSATAPLVIQFEHLYQFEQGGGVNYDGGVIELSDDGGRTWRDISTYVAPGYGGVLTTGNPLVGRNAFVGQSTGFPNLTTVNLNLGNSLAGRTIRVRFRVATDAGVGALGWVLDNLAFSGITNRPFSALIDNAGQCVCATGLTECSGTCTDVQSDLRNCGGCGNVCPANALCSRGQCVTGCQTGLSACGNRCVDLQSDETNCGSCGTACPAGSVCSAGRCSLSCQQGLSNCNGRCTDLQSDLANCGGCGNACPSGSVCSAGRCALSCQQGLTDCSGRCADLQNDRANCGACGNTCAAGTVCSAGQCVVSCQPGQAICNGRCTDLQNDLANCGSCGTACPSGNVCSAGRCALSCQQGLANCNGRCADLAGDQANCGSCGNACAAGTVCSAGQCVVSCQQGLSICNGRCTDLQSDLANCGSCGNACPAGTVCSAGTCAQSCQQGLANCNGRCTDLQTDEANCGSCGTSCAAGNVCTAGQCTLSCQQGLTNCNGRCTDLTSDLANCGACGTACPSGTVCSAGQCAQSCQQGLTICNGRCADLQSDLANCGACGVACPSGTVCSAGQCAQSCQQGLTSCNGRCTDLQNDLANCGACGTACPSGSVCSAGQCAQSCQQGLSTCNGRCADLQTDEANCGACGTACPSGSLCSAGQCSVSCQQGLTSCNGRCIDLQTDRTNCGSCGTACPAGNVCSAGQCAVSCQQGLTECNGLCANLQTDEANCGTCGTTCPAGSACSAGRCQRPPVVRTGPAQFIESGRTVTLDASQSTDPEGDPLTFSWTQIAGPTVSLSGQDRATPTFTAPTVTARTRFGFQVTVSDGFATVSATVDVFVEPPVVGGGGKGGCSVDNRHEAPGPLALLLVPALLAFVLRRRRQSA